MKIASYSKNNEKMYENCIVFENNEKMYEKNV